jgi:predicted dehydrogenase
MMSTRREWLKQTMAASLGGLRLGLAGQAKSGKVRLAVVGGGFGASFHWHEHPQCTVTAVTDLYSERRQKLRDAYRCDTVYNSLEELLKVCRNVDAVAIFSGAPSHFAHVRMCMEHGLHVVSAVPACMNLEEAERLREIKEKTGLRYMMAESSYYRPTTIYARDLYNKGGFGRIFYSEVEYLHDFDFDERLRNRSSAYFNPDGSNSWRMALPPMAYPTHSIAFVVAVTRERITTVSCLGVDERTRLARVPSNVYGNPFFNEFAVMRTNGGNAVRHIECRQIAAAEAERAQWFGEKGTLYMAKPGILADTWQPRFGKPGPIIFPNYWDSDLLPTAMRHQSGHGGSAVFISAEFVNALLEGREPVVNIYEALAMTVPGIVAHQSALNNGELMKVPNFDRRKG